jgi:hypothetical protein
MSLFTSAPLSPCLWKRLDDAVPFFLCVGFASLGATGEHGSLKALLAAVLVDHAFQD